MSSSLLVHFLSAVIIFSFPGGSKLRFKLRWMAQCPTVYFLHLGADGGQTLVKSEGTSSIHFTSFLQMEGGFISLRPLSLFFKLKHETVSKGRLLAFFCRLYPQRSEIYDKASQALKLSAALAGLEVLPLPPTQKKGRRGEKVRKKNSCVSSRSVYKVDFGHKQKIRRTAKDRLPEAAGGWLSQSLVSAPPPPPPSPLPHLYCDENRCPPQAQRHSRVLSGD